MISVPDYQLEGLTLLLPIFPPTVNALYRAHRGSIISSARARAFYIAGLEAIAQLRPTWEQLPLEGRLECTIKLMPPTTRKLDIDNAAKPILDLLVKAAVLEDDSQVDILHVYRLNKHKGGMIEVSITPIMET